LRVTGDVFFTVIISDGSVTERGLVVGDFLREKSHNVALGQSESFCFECYVGNKISLCFLVIKVAPQRLVYIRSGGRKKKKIETVERKRKKVKRLNVEKDTLILRKRR
jgi:hypothetical protein